MQKLKYRLDRSTLYTIYISFIRPKLEYGSIVWDDCTQYDKCRLENIQHRCARIITGAKKGTSHELLYKELPIPSLAVRRKEYKLKFMYNVMHDRFPSYLYECIPENVTNRYNLRNQLCVPNFKLRTVKFEHSLLPQSIKLWNDLPVNVRSMDNYNEYKSSICCKSAMNKLCNGVTRKLNIIHAQLRMKCSNLNHHLFNLHVIESPFCSVCKNIMEDNFHYFFVCPLYHIERNVLFSQVNNILLNKDTLTVNILLNGSKYLNLKKNAEIIQLVENYIHNTGRFQT